MRRIALSLPIYPESATSTTMTPTIPSARGNSNTIYDDCAKKTTSGARAEHLFSLGSQASRSRKPSGTFREVDTE